MIKDLNNCWWMDLGYPGEYVYGDGIYIDEWYIDERWLPVNGLGEFYWVSTHGRVWSYLENRFIYGSPCNKCGHIDLSLRDYDGKRIHRFMHRLVAEAFIPNPHGYPDVLHGPDDDPGNNCVWNLRWGTQLDNTRDCIDRGRFKFFSDEDRELAMQKRRMSIVAYNVRSGERFEFISQCEAARKLNMSQSEISAVILGNRHRVGSWIFARCWDDIPDIESIDIHRHAKRPMIRATSIRTGVIMRFKGLTAAANQLGVNISSISNVLHGKQRVAKGWIFEYVDEEEYDE